MTAVDPALLDAVEQAHAAGDGLPWSVDPERECLVIDSVGCSTADCSLPDDAALIVAAVNAAPTLIRAARERDALRTAVLALAAELATEAAKHPNSYVAQAMRVDAARLRAVVEAVIPDA